MKLNSTLPARLVFCLLLTVASAVNAFEKPGFPRLGGYLIGSPQNYEDPAYQAGIAKLDIAILNVWPGWQGFNGANTTMQKTIQSIKARNSNILIFLYMNINELQTAQSSEWASELSLLNANHWWLYPSGTSGMPVTSTWGNGFGIINTSAFSTVDGSHNRYIDWRAKYQVQTFYATTPAIDGFYTDNFFWKPRVDGDWNLDGTTDRASNATVQTWYRQGYRAYLDNLKAQMPGKMQIGNISDWGGAASAIPEYTGQLNGGLMEAILGYSYSPETWGGWAEMMRQYRKMLGAVSEPKLAIFHQDGDPSDYRAFRYGFASCLMDDAYYYFSVHDKYVGVNWFDEYDAALGFATSAPSTVAWQKGVFRRDFENGIALVNPKGNGTQTVTLESTYRRISGKQAPTVNNGQLASTVTLNDRDGIVLLRLQAQRRPSAPPAVSVQ